MDPMLLLEKGFSFEDSYELNPLEVAALVACGLGSAALTDACEVWYLVLSETSEGLFWGETGPCAGVALLGEHCSTRNVSVFQKSVVPLW